MVIVKNGDINFEVGLNPHSINSPKKKKRKKRKQGDNKNNWCHKLQTIMKMKRK